MSQMQLYRTDAMAAGGAASARPAWSASQPVVAEVCDAARLADLRPHWDDLVSRTDAPNVFMDPALIAAADAADPQTRHGALLAWTARNGERRLTGALSFSVGRPPRSMLPMNVLRSPAYRHGHLATPVIDRDGLDETLDAMLDAVAADATLPKIIAFDGMTADDSVYAALLRVLERRGSAPCILAQTRRPMLLPGLDGKAYLEQSLSGSTRKKLRQHRRKLGETGALVSSVASEPDAVRGALEDFLAMEAAGWKGREGTALLSDPADAAFMRGAVGALADLGCAAIHSIHCGGKPVSMQIVARSGGAVFTWKTAYDEAFRDFSPGMLLLEDYTTAFLADPGIAFADSCSFDDTGFMSAWTGRRTTADLWIDARRGGSLEFRALSGLQKSYGELRATAKAAYHGWLKSRKK